MGGDKGTAVGIAVGRAARELFPESATPKLWHHVLAAAFTTASELAADGIIGKLVNTAGTMYLQAVMPALEHLTSATAPLRISPDADLAAATRALTSVAITYANEAKSGGRGFKRADRGFEESLSRFMSVAAREKKH
jgi:hypothetical protein